MVVQHNLYAMNADRMQSITHNNLAKSTEKLSSGYKVNRAADDAAGLSISEKMQKQIKGLSQASLNAQDGISAVQTAEGALTEVHDMLQRMNELAVKASNGTLSENDRQDIQNEVDQLLTEIDRVAETTKFNETYLLKGDSTREKKVPMFIHDAGLMCYDKGWEVGHLECGLNKKKMHVSTGDKDDPSHLCEKTRIQGAERDPQYSMLAIQVTHPNGSKITIGGIEYTLDNSISSLKTPARDGNTVNTAYLQYIIAAELRAANSFGATTPVDNNSDDSFPHKNRNSSRYVLYPRASVTTNADVYLSLHAGADADGTNKIGLKIEAMDTKSLGIQNLRVMGRTSEYTPANGTMATYAIDAIDDAIYRVSQTRSRLGAVQNRLEHSIKNLDNVVENTTFSYSQIKDTDMAKEMVSYSNNNILSQAGQSMLAQANQANQGVLSLLR